MINLSIYHKWMAFILKIFETKCDLLTFIDELIIFYLNLHCNKINILTYTLYWNK